MTSSAAPLVFGLMLPLSARDLNVAAILESRLQIDNRWNRSARVLGEVWADLRLFSVSEKWQIKLSAAERFSALSNDTHGKLVQAYFDKFFLPLRGFLRLGRFHRTDLSGFYLLDGGAWSFTFKDLQGFLYGGKPHRIDDVRSVSGDYLFGFGGNYNQPLTFRWGNFHLLRLDLGAEFQQFRRQRTVQRLRSGIALKGRWGAIPMAFSLASIHRFDRSLLEDLDLTFIADPTKTLRLRVNYEFYHPRSPLVTFRERFTSRYAFGEQSLFRAELHHRPTPSWHYFMAGMRATKRDGRDGWGMQAGIGHRFPFDLFSEVVYDTLRLGKGQARSLYVRSRYLVHSRFELDGGFAFRYEKKQFYSRNVMRGAFFEGRYFLGRSWTISCAFNYIANSKRRDDFVAEVRLIYYFDRFQPKRQACPECPSLFF